MIFILAAHEQGATVVGGSLSLLSWFTHRKERIRREELFKNSKVQPESTEAETKEAQR